MINLNSNNGVKSDKKTMLSNLISKFFNQNNLKTLEDSSLEQQTLLEQLMDQFYFISLSNNEIASIQTQTLKQKYSPSFSSLICQRNSLLKYKAHRRRQNPTKIFPYNNTINTTNSNSDTSFKCFNSSNKKKSFKIDVYHSGNSNKTESKGYSANINRRKINHTIDNFNSSNQIAKCLNFKMKTSNDISSRKSFNLTSFKPQNSKLKYLYKKSGSNNKKNEIINLFFKDKSNIGVIKIIFSFLKKNNSNLHNITKLTRVIWLEQKIKEISFKMIVRSNPKSNNNNTTEIMKQKEIKLKEFLKRYYN